jgi:hypothetical protein
MWDWENSWCEETAQLAGEIGIHATHVNSLVFDDTGRKMITADAEGELRIWVCGDDRFREWALHVTIREPTLHGIPIDAIHLHPSGRRVLVSDACHGD